LGIFLCMLINILPNSSMISWEKSLSIPLSNTLYNSPGSELGLWYCPRSIFLPFYIYHKLCHSDYQECDSWFCLGSVLFSIHLLALMCELPELDVGSSFMTKILVSRCMFWSGDVCAFLYITQCCSSHLSSLWCQHFDIFVWLVQQRCPSFVSSRPLWRRRKIETVVALSIVEYVLQNTYWDAVRYCWWVYSSSFHRE
jgi:hypothetical protein